MKMPRTRRRSMRTMLLAAGIALASTWGIGGVVGAGPASAAPQLARITTTGNDFGAFGDRAYCHGALNVGLASPRRGVVRLTLTSHGFTGTGRDWARDPHCGVLFGVTYTSATAFMKETLVPATLGARPGQRIVRDIPTGSGVVEFSVVPYAKKAPLRGLQGYGFGAYVIVP